MHDCRNQLFAGAGFAENQDGCIGAGHAAYGLVDVLHGGAVTDENLILVALRHHANHALAEIAALEKALHGHSDFVQLKRLGDIVEGAELHRLNGGGGRAKRRHDDDR